MVRTSCKQYDIILVGFMAQMILPLWSWKFRHSEVLVDFFISIYDTLVDDRKKFSAGSLPAKCMHWLDWRTLSYAKYIITDTKAHGRYFVEELGADSAKVVDHVHTGAILVDGLGVGDVGNIVLRDRQHLAEDGIMIVVMTLEKHSNQLLAGPDIVSRGFVYVRESEDLMEEARSVVEEAVTACLERGVSDWGKLKNVTRDALRDLIWKRTKRDPMILPIIMEV